MDQLLSAAPWLMAVAAIVSAAACVAAWRAVPWQGRQTALIMAAVMMVMATTRTDALIDLALGAVLLISAMLGTMGVRGTPAAATCCHRALVSLVMAMCSFDAASTSTAEDQVSMTGEAAAAVVGHGGHGLTGTLSFLVLVGAISVVLWAVIAEWFSAPGRRSRTARLLTTESWAMAVGVGVMCLGF